MTILVNREDAIASCERLLKGCARLNIDRFLEDFTHIEPAKSSFFGLIKTKSRISKHYYFGCKSTFKALLTTNQIVSSKRILERAKMLTGEYVPVTEEEIEFMRNWWIPTTRFMNNRPEV